MGTKENPGKFDCYAKAKPDEPVFVLLGRDRVAAAAIRYWVQMRRASESMIWKNGQSPAAGESEDEQNREALLIAKACEQYAYDYYMNKKGADDGGKEEMDRKTKGDDNG